MCVQTGQPEHETQDRTARAVNQVGTAAKAQRAPDRQDRTDRVKNPKRLHPRQDSHNRQDRTGWPEHEK
jgi:hypothetical protein